MICNICRTSIPAPVSPWSWAPGKGRCRTCSGTLASENQKKVIFLWSLVLHKPWYFFFFISLLVECRNLTGFTFTNFFFFCGQGRLWLSFLTAIYLIHGTTFIMYAFLWEKKHVTNCLYILAPCKVFFLFFYTKSSIVWHSPLLITTSLINFESVTLEFIMQNIYCSRRKTFF